jgi:hypothetical protein
MGLQWESRSPRKSLMAVGFMIELHSQWAASSVVEHVTFNHGAVGSIPTRPTKSFRNPAIGLPCCEEVQPILQPQGFLAA